MITRDLFQPEHEAFRDTVRRFIDKEIAPHHAQWEEDGVVSREVWRKAGAAGLLCCTIPEEYGGIGADYLFDVVVFEEVGAAGYTGPGFMIHCDLVATYIKSFGSEAQKKHWLPKMVTGEAIGSLGMTEPHAGSDLKAIRTKAVRDGDDYVINGQKVFISNGQMCDVLVLATKTDSAAGAKGVTLFLVDTSLPGFRRGKNLSKLGQERLAQAIRSAAVAERVIDYTVQYTGERKAFGQTIGDFQNTQFKLAELATDTAVGRQFTDKCIQLFMDGKLDAIDAAMAKMYVTNLHCRVVDECLQLFGGWGYMWEYPIARAYADARIVKIAGGSIEIMKHIIGRHLFSRFKPRKPLSNS